MTQVEIYESATCRYSRQVRRQWRLQVERDEIPVVADGKNYSVTHYSHDMEISVGYRVKSAEGVRS